MKKLFLSYTIGLASATFAWLYVFRQAILEGLITVLDTIAERLVRNRRYRRKMGYVGQVNYQGMTSRHERRRRNIQVPKR